MKQRFLIVASLTALVWSSLCGQDWCSSRTHYDFGCPTFIGSADLDGDGDEDLFVTSCCSAEFSLTTLFNDGTGAFPNVVTNSFRSGGLGGPGACVLDIDLDGDLDIVVPDHFNNCLKILLNNGAGAFSQSGCIATTLPSSLDSPFEAASADFNGDGYPDVAAVSRTLDKVIIFLNDQAGSLTVAAFISTGDEPFFIQTADLNGDSEADLVVSIAMQDEVSVFLGNGDGTFQSPISSPVGSRPYYFKLADLNSDGLMDVSSGYNTLGSWSVSFGNGDGTFGNPTFYGGFSGFTTHWSGDIDADGDIDIVSAISGLDSMYVWSNDGNGVFTNAGSCWVGDQPFCVTMADFNADGSADAAVANYGVTDPAGVAVFLSPYEAVQTLQVNLDIKPGSCPNPLNTRANGPCARAEDASETEFALEKPKPTHPQPSRAVLPVAILGTENFDVTSIVVSSLTLEGVPALRWGLEDVSSPVVVGAEDCECTESGVDGLLDLTLKFDRSAVIEALGEVYDGDIIPVTVSGTLTDGRPLTATDCVLIISGNGGSNEIVNESSAAILANYPNPFNPTTQISFALPKPAEVNLTIYNILGEKVVTLTEGARVAGVHSVTWDGRDSRGNNVASGVYFYRLDAGEFSATKKMLMMK
ncbi:MAG: VCBS repeat-containing protein [candidate division Zixibacteria bacterium]|nr:VCBS repeat-containing protein [candidate division Zixibacteria bacterium]